MALGLRDRCFYAEILNVFDTLTLKQIFWKTKTFFEKPGFRFLVESTRIENASFPYRTGWCVQNRPITKNGVLPVTTVFFWKFYFSLRTSYKELTWYTNNPNAHVSTFCKHWSFIWWCFFPVSILKNLRLGKSMLLKKQSFQTYFL